MAITKYFKIIDTNVSPGTSDVYDNVDMYWQGSQFGNYTWYNMIVQGSAQRFNKYREYEVMDSDIEISIALDIIAEEIFSSSSKEDLPFKINVTTNGGLKVRSNVVASLSAALKTWCNIHDWRSRIYQIARNTVKYGDCFFIRPKNKFDKFIYVSPKNVLAAKVSKDDPSNVLGWFISDKWMGNGAPPININDENVKYYPAEDVIRFSLFDETSEQAPFGQSILTNIYRTFRQKQLIEDSIIIYRVQRAPEKRVFKIDVGNIHPAKINEHLNRVKNEIKQRIIPSVSGGTSTEGIDSIYNPMSMNEDYFFAKTKDGGGSSVELLSGGQNLGELRDLEFFNKKLWRGLRIPASYIDPNAESSTANDGKVGIAYLQEIKFSLYIERLQRQFDKVFDTEFKKFLNECGINVDETTFNIMLPSPNNYAASRKQAINNELINTYQTADGIRTLSKRFALKKYLQLTDEEILTNERMLREEMGMNPNGDFRDLPKLYNPENAEANGFEGGLGSFSGSSSSFTPPDRGSSSLDTEESDDFDIGSEEQDMNPEQSEKEGFEKK